MSIRWVKAHLKKENATKAGVSCCCFMTGTETTRLTFRPKKELQNMVTLINRRHLFIPKSILPRTYRSTCLILTS
eukprot:8405407-Heterocapsa_arctica.AAC.1